VGGEKEKGEGIGKERGWDNSGGKDMGCGAGGKGEIRGREATGVAQIECFPPNFQTHYALLYR